jgi:acetylornithine deacetylase
LLVNVRFWKSQNVKTVEADLKRVLDSIAAKDPQFKYELSNGYGPGPFEQGAITRIPMDVPLDAPIVGIVQESHKHVTGKPCQLQSTLRTTGNDDGCQMNEQGIPTITYGPGPGEKDLDLYARLPIAERWVDIDTLKTCTKVLALTALDVCTREKK